ncbi:coiled-coil domain-containing protein 172 isoform X1 [Pseudoliparis swirei]|uniref:coiled-coil domain-containing protein 172 isoform X1 n=1 Tax=Pseudoliparis swirei TaxID=2059687 RepID=UPI0024BE22B5|nr:coiled-coil domain-containing protein 172 isoform X1 [Pseudoliparis swirei]
MSLDTLFQQILLTEQQHSELTQKNRKVKLAIIQLNEDIKSATEKNAKTCEELESKAQRSSAMELHRDLAKKCEVQMLRQIEEMLVLGNRRRDRLAQTQLEAKEEEQNFLREVSRFNADFSLRANGGVALASRAHGELLELQRELASLHEEMELMSRGNAGVRSVRKEQRALQITLQGLDAAQRDLDRQLAGAEATTHALQAESLLVGRRPLTDATCLRMRKELETHKEGELEILREALSSEIDFLKSRNVDGSQGREQR